ncbi:DUF4263 domain-containing protein [Apibacter muscae]|uniref:Shedu anti-phage system protein SduA domain-containing protein n=1 Tax=Apibacter muscae TaxID=2509004 RepID=UPI0011ACB1CF|nr:Shedu anti-phage system protein SduA domain-containing protein [Apibacter muscae]TWP31560.1 DUF4263 domain-containing protein [Apibacter muscae]
MRNHTIEELVCQFQVSGSSLYELNEIIILLYKQNNNDALNLVLKLAMSDYGGITFKAELQIIAMLGTLHWGIKGLEKLGKSTIKNDCFRAINNVTRLLSHISSKSLNDFFFANSNLPCIKRLNLENEKYKTEEWITNAKKVLIEVVKSVEKNDIFPLGLIQNLIYPFNISAQEHMFAALMIRWFNFNSNNVYKYLELIESTTKKEIIYHNFLKNNPYILEPFHAQIWSKPKFGENLIPDFLIRSMDDAYTVIEIEEPNTSIMTKSGELSAKTTHAKKQALDFRDWAINNNLYASRKYQNIYRPFCLVVIGRESELTEVQKQRLKQENESTQGILKIVGFDKKTFRKTIS